MFAANRFLMTSEPVDRAAHAEWATIEHMRVHHRRADVRVAKQLLHRPDVVPVLQKVGGKRMPQAVAVARLAIPTPCTARLTAR